MGGVLIERFVNFDLGYVASYSVHCSDDHSIIFNMHLNTQANYSTAQSHCCSHSLSIKRVALQSIEQLPVTYVNSVDSVVCMCLVAITFKHRTQNCSTLHKLP